MTFDFDQPIERRNTWSLKWKRYAGRDIIPMWVADMDFRSAPPILDKLHEAVSHGVFGYTDPGPELLEAIIARLRQSYNWNTQPEWYVWLPGLVSGLNIACRTASAAGEDVITGVPVYPPFLSAPKQSDRNCVHAPLVLSDSRWRFPAASLESAITPRGRLLLLCNPHNPVGRAFRRDELLELAEVCLRHDLAICSDEIHCGLLLDSDITHVPIASLSPEIADRTITLMAASKTFNLPSLGTAFAIVPNAQLRQRMLRVMSGIVHRPLGIGLAATLAAYRDGEPWRLALVEYLRGNRDLLENAMPSLQPLTMTHVEATYLAWLDCRALGSHDPIKLFENAGVGLYNGADFGAPGYARLNFACPRVLLEEAINRMRNALRSVGATP